MDLLRLGLGWKPTLIAGVMLEDFGAGYVDHLPNFSSEPTSDVVPLRFTSCKHRQRDEQCGGEVGWGSKSWCLIKPRNNEEDVKFLKLRPGANIKRDFFPSEFK